MSAKKPLFGLGLEEISNIVTELGMPRFTAKQILRWLYIKRADSIDSMTDLSAVNRSRLNEEYCVGRTPHLSVSTSKDGTKKYLLKTSKGAYIESAYIPDRERATLCVSSQAGCRMGCRFCATGRQGLQHSLTSGEILNQIFSLPEFETLTNIVFMGMGEPLDNLQSVLQALEVLTSAWGVGWSPTRITLSTAGVGSALKEFLDRSNVHLAISLHNPFHEEREQIMPIERAWPISGIAETLRQYDFTHQRRVSFEYIVMSGLNDSPRHIKELCRLLDGIKCRINLIRFHKIPDSPYFSPSLEKMIWFRDTLTSKGIQTTIRASRGEDIQAACGLLSTQTKLNEQE